MAVFWKGSSGPQADPFICFAIISLDRRGVQGGTFHAIDGCRLPRQMALRCPLHGLPEASERPLGLRALMALQRKGL